MPLSAAAVSGMSRGSATMGRSMVKTLQAADLKTQDGSLGRAVPPGFSFAIPDRELTKIGNKHAGRFDAASLDRSNPARLVKRT